MTSLFDMICFYMFACSILIILSYLNDKHNVFKERLHNDNPNQFSNGMEFLNSPFTKLNHPQLLLLGLYRMSTRTELKILDILKKKKKH